MIFKRERWGDCQAAVLPLMQAAYDALEPFQDLPLLINTDRYQQLDDMDVLHIVTARDRGALVGQCLVLITPALRHMGQLVAQVDHIWLVPDYRKKGHGGHLLRYAMHHVTQQGACMAAAASRCIDPIDHVLSKIGFEPLELTMVRRL